MKLSLLASFAFALCLGLSARAQTPGVVYAPEQLDQLTGPIALYPDPLVALILPASTFPQQITMAANYLAANGNPAGIDSQPWDASVKGLARYPQVVKWMNDNLPWTEALGAAFAVQASDLMRSIQQLRARARSAGTLVNTPQQTIDVEGDDIRIIPAQQDTIYAPEYDPDVVYDTPEDYEGPYISFGPGYPVGPWLGFDCDWDDFGIWIGPWVPGWAYRREWRHPGAGPHGAWRAWHPDPRSSRQLVNNFYRPEANLPGPRAVAGYRGPAPRQGVTPRPPPPREPARPDYRGRGFEPPRPSRPAPLGNFFGGYGRGVQTREFSNRGQMSRSAPVRAAAPARRSAPPPRAAPSGGGGRDRH